MHAILHAEQCVCPGDDLTYECTVVGAGSTVWTGSAFSCSTSNNEITLLHSRFSSTQGDYGSCNNGDIVARSLSVEGNNYTSQLNVTVTYDTAGKTIMCLYSDGYNDTLQLSLVIPPTGLSSRCTNIASISYLSFNPSKNYRSIFTTR